MTNFPNHTYVHSDNLEKFNNDIILLPELRRNIDVLKKFDSKFYYRDIFSNGVYHGLCTLSNMVHIVIGMGYKKVIFPGVDLYNSKYFWMKNKKRLSIKNINDRHKIAQPTVDMLKEIKRMGLIDLYSYNNNSMLSNFLPVWRQI